MSETRCGECSNKLVPICDILIGIARTGIEQVAQIASDTVTRHPGFADITEPLVTRAALRNTQQFATLQENLAGVGCTLTPEQITQRLQTT